VRLTKKTETKRVTLTQEARVIVGPEREAPSGSYRRVQVVVPMSPQMFLLADVPAQSAFEAVGVGPNRTYKMAPLSAGQTLVVRLLPEQFLTALSGEGLCFCTLIIEHIQGGDDA
jgi:hypothetical protein